MMNSNKSNSVLLAKHLERLTYKAPAGFLMVDQKGRIIFANRLIEKIESYIHAHSEAEFSHGLCPQCAKELYPDLDIYDDGK
jgi:hypothetical protein